MFTNWRHNTGVMVLALLAGACLVGLPGYADYGFIPKGFQEVEKANAPKPPQSETVKSDAATDDATTDDGEGDDAPDKKTEAAPEQKADGDANTQNPPEKGDDKVDMGQSGKTDAKDKGKDAEKPPTAEEKYKGEQNTTDQGLKLPEIVYTQTIRMQYGYCHPGYVDISGVSRQALRTPQGVSGVLKTVQAQVASAGQSTVMRTQNYVYKGFSANRITFSQAVDGKTQYVVSDTVLNKPYLYVARYESPYPTAINTGDPNACFNRLAGKVLH